MKAFLRFSLIFFIAITYISCDYNIAQTTLAEAGFSLNNIKSLEVKGSFCNVVMEGSNSNILKFEGYIKGNGNPDKYEIGYEEDGGHVKVWVNYPNSVWGNIRSELNFSIPEGVLVVVDNSSGNISARNMKAEKLTFEASSGNIDAENMNGELGLDCSSGNITLTGQTGNLTAKASSGNLKIENVDGISALKTTSGNIQLYENEGNVTVECSSGNIKLKSVTGTLYARATSGNISGRDIKLTGDSGFKASSGNITIDLNNHTDDLSFDLDAGSGNLYAAGSSGEDKIIIKRGPINISGVTSSGNQHYSTMQ